MYRPFHCPDAQAFLRLLHAPGGLVAVRSLHPQQEWHYTHSQHSQALTLLERHSGQRALYACLNPVRPDMGTGYAQDEDITALRWFPLDADPIRPSDTASTDAEKDAAAPVLDALLDFLRQHLPGLDDALVLCDSGNGSHALLRLPDYPPHAADQPGQRSPQWHTLKRLHTALCRGFSTPAVKLDPAVMNPSRIWRIPGTLNIKGDNTPDRPHRMARLLTPEDFTPTPLDLLAHAETLLAALGTSPAAFPSPSFPLPEGEGEALAPERGSDGLPPWWTELVTPGDRNNAAYRRTRWLLNATKGGRTEDAAWDELKAWNKVVCRPPLDADELRQTFHSARKSGDNPAYAHLSPSLSVSGRVAEERGREGSGAPWPKPLSSSATPPTPARALPGTSAAPSSPPPTPIGCPASPAASPVEKG